MDPKKTLLIAIESRKGPASLVDAANKLQADGVSVDECYQALQQIWLDFGFDDADDENPVRNDLETVMEKLWFQAKAG
jgi:hypothetical protein